MRSIWSFLSLGLLSYSICEGYVTLKSPRVTNLGIWQYMAHCPANTYATGMQVKYEEYQGNGDDTALNEVVFYCQPLGNSAAPKNVWITGGSGPKGTWQPISWCPAGESIIGFALQSDPYWGETGDDFGAVNIQALCGYAYGPRNIYNRIQSESSNYGSWSAYQFCPRGTVACGIQSQIEATHSGDNTALNNVNVDCCEIANNGNPVLFPPAHHSMIMSPRITNYGRWYTMAHCPDNHYATGLEVQYEKYQGYGDDTALNNVALRCQPISDLNTPTSPKNIWVYNGRGYRGAWQPVQWCPLGQAIIGFALLSDPDHGNTGDNFGAENIAAYCGYAHGPRTPYNLMQIETSQFGSWTKDQFCLAGYIVCGIQVQIEYPHSGDNKALDNVNVDCCRIDSTDPKHYPPTDHLVLPSPQITNRRRWYNMAHCPKDLYATGMQIKNEKYQGFADDTGLNSVALYCQPLNSPSAPKDVSITGGVGPKGEFNGVPKEKQL